MIRSNLMMFYFFAIMQSSYMLPVYLELHFLLCNNFILKFDKEHYSILHFEENRAVKNDTQLFANASLKLYIFLRI